MTRNFDKTNAEQVKKQNQQSAQPNSMSEEFASETDVNQVKQQNQQSEAKKSKASGNAQSFGSGTK